MPSPFPGMDPYLEGELWSNFHTQFAVEIARTLNPKLAPRYVAVTEKYQNSVGPEEIGIGSHPEAFIPDVGVSRSTSNKKPKNGGVGVLTPPLKLDTLISIPVNHVWVKILDLSNRLLVTAIEFLSPTNKRGAGRKRYLKKRRRLLLSQAHLLEIDLLRSGRRVPMADPLPAAPYFVLLSRAQERPSTAVWPIALEDALPTVAVPLLPNDPDVDLHLQQVFQSVYDLGNMEYLIDYHHDPDVPLPSDLAAWSDQLLRQAGKRT